MDFVYYNNTWSAMCSAAGVLNVINIVIVDFKVIFIRKMSFRNKHYIYFLAGLEKFPARFYA